MDATKPSAGCLESDPSRGDPRRAPGSVLFHREVRRSPLQLPPAPPAFFLPSASPQDSQGLGSNPSIATNLLSLSFPRWKVEVCWNQMPAHLSVTTMLGGRYHPSLCKRPQAGLWLGPRGHEAGKGGSLGSITMPWVLGQLLQAKRSLRTWHRGGWRLGSSRLVGEGSRGHLPAPGPGSESAFLPLPWPRAHPSSAFSPGCCCYFWPLDLPGLQPLP